MNTKCICINSDPNICRAWRYGQSVFFGNTRFPPCDCVCHAAQSDNTQTPNTPSTTQHAPANADLVTRWLAADMHGKGLIVQQEAAAELAALRAQRDDLLAAMKAVIEMVDYAVEAHAHVSDTCITMQKARAAIARATEEA